MIGNGHKEILFIVLTFLLLIPPISSQEKPDLDPDPAETLAVSKWLKKNAIPLKSVEAGHGFEDLMPLKRILKDIRVVGLGESTHSSREFFQFKHRMLEFLVKEMGFTLFVVEAGYPGCLVTNDYILYGKGDRKSAIDGLKWRMFKNEEMAALIDWLYNYNKRVPSAKKVKFYGMDFQGWEGAKSHIISFVERVNPEFLKTILSETKQFQINPIELLKYFASNKAEYIRLSSAQDYQAAVQNVRILIQSKRIERRNQYMAENVKSFLDSEGPGKRIVVSAHNTHIANRGLFRWAADFEFGSHLKNMFGDAYYALGLTSNSYTFEALNSANTKGGWREFKLGPTPRGYVEWYLTQAGIKKYIVDFRAAPQKGPVAEWMRKPHIMRYLRSYHSTKMREVAYTKPTILRKLYDGLVYIDVSNVPHYLSDGM